MSDVVTLLVLAIVLALVGIGAGILVGRPLDRFVNRDDDADTVDADGASAERDGADGP